MFTVDNKFEIGQEVYLIKSKRKMINTIKTCDMCLGDGAITHNGYIINCPICKGKREIILESESRKVYTVDPVPHKITSIRFTVSQSGNNIRYHLKGKNFADDVLFLSINDAHEACEKLNSQELGKNQEER